MKFSVMHTILMFFAFLLLTNNLKAEESANDVITRWCTTQIEKWSPPGKSTFVSETEADGKLRYESIAKDAISVIFDPNEVPLFTGDFGRSKTLALVLSVMKHESGFRKDVDIGVGKYARGDSGASWCLGQINLSQPDSNGKTSVRIELDDKYYKYSFDANSLVGFGGKDLVEDRKKCIRVSLHMLRRSFDSCSYLDVTERLSEYASGKCKYGKKASKIRMYTFNEFINSSSPPVDDMLISRSIKQSFETEAVEVLAEK